MISIEIDENGKPEIKATRVEELTVDDFKDYYKEVMKQKPKQLPMGEYRVVECDSCSFEGTIHVKQTFCPKCHKLVNVIQPDANFDFDTLFQSWQVKKQCIESIINGNVVDFVEDYKECHTMKEDDLTEYSMEEEMGEETIVDEPIDF